MVPVNGDTSDGTAESNNGDMDDGMYNSVPPVVTGFTLFNEVIVFTI